MAKENVNLVTYARLAVIERDLKVIRDPWIRRRLARERREIKDRIAAAESRGDS